MSIFCNKCNKLLPRDLLTGNKLKCDCRIFELIDEDGDKHHARGRDFEEAAQTFAEGYDPGNDYFIVQSSDGEVFFMTDLSDGDKKTVRITGEQVIEYSVNEI